MVLLEATWFSAAKVTVQSYHLLLPQPFGPTINNICKVFWHTSASCNSVSAATVIFVSCIFPVLNLHMLCNSKWRFSCSERLDTPREKNNPFCWLWQLSELCCLCQLGNLRTELSPLKTEVVMTEDQRTKARFNINSMHISSVLFTIRTFRNSSGWVSRVKMLDYLNLGPNIVPQSWSTKLSRGCVYLKATDIPQ